MIRGNDNMFCFFGALLPVESYNISSALMSISLLHKTQPRK